MRQSVRHWSVVGVSVFTLWMTVAGHASVAMDRPDPTVTLGVGACLVSPRTFAEIQALRNSVVPERQPPLPEEPGQRAPPGTHAEIEARVQAFLDCSAAGEPLRVWALYSDAYLARLLVRERGYDRARYDADSVPQPLESGDQPVLMTISPTTAYGDDRAMARVVIWYPNLHREKTLDWWFVRVDSVWLIDEIDGEITFAVP